VAETTVNNYKLRASRHLKRDETSVLMLIEDMSRNEINILFRFECHMFYVLYPFVIYLLTLTRNFLCQC
jgi:hypothetical protein